MTNEDKIRVLSESWLKNMKPDPDEIPLLFELKRLKNIHELVQAYIDYYNDNDFKPYDLRLLEINSYVNPSDLEDDEIWIDIDFIDIIDFNELRDDITKELIKINPSLLLHTSYRIRVSYQKSDQDKRVELQINFGFIHHKSLTESIRHTFCLVYTSQDNFIKLSPYKIAKSFSDRINEIALAHASK